MADSTEVTTPGLIELKPQSVQYTRSSEDSSQTANASTQKQTNMQSTTADVMMLVKTISLVTKKSRQILKVNAGKVQCNQRCSSLEVILRINRLKLVTTTDNKRLLSIGITQARVNWCNSTVVQKQCSDESFWPLLWFPKCTSHWHD